MRPNDETDIECIEYSDRVIEPRWGLDVLGPHDICAGGMVFSGPGWGHVEGFKIGEGWHLINKHTTAARWVRDNDPLHPPCAEDGRHEWVHLAAQDDIEEHTECLWCAVWEAPEQVGMTR
jgi:hypothetical protein